MRLFADASALVAVLAKEEDWLPLGERIISAGSVIWSPVSRWETIAALCLSYKLSRAEAEERTDQFALENGFTMISISEKEAVLATEAYFQFGKAHHPAKLNMGDCFAYACAKANNAHLLYKGNDFAKTDLA